MENASPAMWQGTTLSMENYRFSSTALGKGSTATVYYARRHIEAGDDSDPTEIALKAMPDVSKLSAEVSILASLQQHPNIINFYGVCSMEQHSEVDGTSAPPCLAIQLQFCSDSLEDAVARQRFSEHSAHLVMLDLFRGLEHMHKLGFVHRDVKPENVLLTSDGTAKITDFGISAQLSDEGSMVMRCGTPGFAAPELLLGHKYGIKVDTFSSGALLYYIISGKLPFAGRNVQSIGYKTVNAPVNFRRSVCLERLSDACKEFMETLLMKEPDDRPDSTEALQLMSPRAPEENQHDHGGVSALEWTTPRRPNYAKSLACRRNIHRKVITGAPLQRRHSVSQAVSLRKRDTESVSQDTSDSHNQLPEGKSPSSVLDSPKFDRDESGAYLLQEPRMPIQQAPASRSPAMRKYLISKPASESDSTEQPRTTSKLFSEAETIDTAPEQLRTTSKLFSEAESIDTAPCKESENCESTERTTYRTETPESPGSVPQSFEASVSMSEDTDLHHWDMLSEFKASRPKERAPRILGSCSSLWRKLRYSSAPTRRYQQ